MDRTASDQIAADFRSYSRNGILVADIISDLGVFGGTASGSLLCIGVFGILAVSIGIGGSISFGGAFPDPSGGAV